MLLNGILCYAGAPGRAILGLVNVLKEDKPTGEDFSFITGGGNGTFDQITNTVKSTGASAFQLIRTIGIIGFVIAILFLGMSIGLNKNAQKRSESKDWMIWLAVGMIIFFAAMFIIGLFSDVGANLGK